MTEDEIHIMPVVDGVTWPTIQQAMTMAMRDIGAVGKNEKNTQQGFSFRGIDAVVNAVHPAFVEHGITVSPQVMDVQRESVTSRSGSLLHVVHVIVQYRFFGPGGDWMDATVAAESFDSGDKATAKAMSVAFRTALLQALCLPTDEPDADLDTFERGPAQTKVDQDVITAAVNGVKKYILTLCGGDQDAALALFQALVQDDPPPKVEQEPTPADLHQWQERVNSAAKGEAGV